MSFQKSPTTPGGSKSLAVHERTQIPADEWPQGESDLGGIHWMAGKLAWDEAVKAKAAVQ